MTARQPPSRSTPVPGQRPPALDCPRWCVEHSQDAASPGHETQHRSAPFGSFVDFYEGDTYEAVLERWDENDRVASEHVELLRRDPDTGGWDSVLYIPLSAFRTLAAAILEIPQAVPAETGLSGGTA